MLQIRLQHLPVRSQCYEKGRHERLCEGGGVRVGNGTFRPGSVSAILFAETSLKLLRLKNMDVLGGGVSRSIIFSDVAAQMSLRN